LINCFKKENRIDKKMEWKLIDVTLPRMEDKPTGLNTQREEGPLIKLRGS